MDIAEIREQFDAPEALGEGCELLFAVYELEDWSGEAFVLFRDADGTLKYVIGGHCSCFGLEGQWKPVATTKEYLLEAADYMYKPRDGKHYDSNKSAIKNHMLNAKLRAIVEAL